MYFLYTKIGKKEAKEIAVISYFANEEQICSNCKHQAAVRLKNSFRIFALRHKFHNPYFKQVKHYDNNSIFI